MLVVNADCPTDHGVNVHFGLGISLTVRDGDLPRRPVVGDVLRIRLPLALAIIENGDDNG